MEWEVGVNAAESGNEMVFEGADGSLSGIATVDSRWDKLIVDCLSSEEVLEDGGAFVVEALELWAESGCAELGMERAVGLKNRGTFACLHGFGQDAIAVIVV